MVTETVIGSQSGSTDGKAAANCASSDYLSIPALVGGKNEQDVGLLP
jgi:hypothetical protein